MNPNIALTVFGIWLLIMMWLLQRGIPLGAVILAASTGLSLALGRGFFGLASDAIEVTMDSQVIELLVIITLIFLFSSILKGTRRMEKIATLLRLRLKDPRFVLIAVPSLVGLIPMPGGAMFTAPITDEVGREIDLSPEDKVFSNYWFRHFWELAFPLYPGIILCAGLIKLPPLDLARDLWPLAAAAFLSGTLLSLYRWKNRAVAKGWNPREKKPDKGNPEASFVDPGLWTLWPVLAVIIIAVLKLPLSGGLLIINILLAVSEKVGLKDFLGFCWESLQFAVILLIWAVFLFGRVLTSTGLLAMLGAFFVNVGMPLALVSFLLPFFMGALTGVTTGFVGTVFPLLIPLWGKNLIPWVQFAYASGLAGIFITPAHLCLSLTQDYFKADLKKVIGLILIPVSFIMFLALVRLGLGASF